MMDWLGSPAAYRNTSKRISTQTRPWKNDEGPAPSVKVRENTNFSAHSGLPTVGDDWVRPVRFNEIKFGTRLDPRKCRWQPLVNLPLIASVHIMALKLSKLLS